MIFGILSSISIQKYQESSIQEYLGQHFKAPRPDFGPLTGFPGNRREASLSSKWGHSKVISV